MPLSELNFILKNSQEKGWSSHLLYRRSLPLTGSHTQFLRYHCTSWPFVPESNGFSLELEEPADIAYDTVGRTMFVLYDCPGTNPEIC